MLEKIIMLLILLLPGCVHEPTHTQENNNLNQCSSLNTKIDTFMRDIFGRTEPRVEDYYKYQGAHSEEEYGAELDYCKKQWGNPHNFDDASYVEYMPTECKSWLLGRAKNRNAISLYYQSLRRQFKKLPVEFQITDMKSYSNSEYGKGCLIYIGVPDERATILLRVFHSITDPEERLFVIDEIRKE